MLQNFILAFVPLFFAVDAIGILPMFVNLTEDLDTRERKKVVAQSLITALGVAIGFIAFGQTIFRYLGVTVQDFMVAGGLLLLLISVSDLLSGDKVARKVGSTIGAVPIGMPLIVGPAVLTTALMLVDAHGWVATVSAIVLNIAIAGAVLMSSSTIIRLLGPSGSRVVSKVASLVLAAIAVMMIRRGLTIMIVHPV